MWKKDGEMRKKRKRKREGECVCVCVWWGGGERERERERERENRTEQNGTENRNCVHINALCHDLEAIIVTNCHKP